MEKVKNIIFKVKMNGVGTVNFDGTDSRYAVKKYAKPAMNSPYNNDNIKIAKSVYTQIGTDEDGQPIYKRTLKISSECLRHAIFEKYYDVINGRIMKNDALLASYISSPAALLRGYMFADDITIKRKSPITISEALETSDAVIMPELGSVSGDKNETSLFFTENVGKTEYIAEGCIDFKQLEFLSCDDFFERRAIKDSWVETENGILNVAFKQRYGGVPYIKGIYTASGNTLTNHIGEFGLRFDEQFEKYLVIEFFKRLLNVNIKRSGSYAKVSSIMARPVYDALDGMYDNPDGWTELTLDNIDDFINTLDLYQFYNECDNDAKAVMDELYLAEKQKKNDREAKKAEKKSKKATSKVEEEVSNEDGSFVL